MSFYASQHKDYTDPDRALDWIDQPAVPYVTEAPNAKQALELLFQQDIATIPADSDYDGDIASFAAESTLILLDPILEVLRCEGWTITPPELPTLAIGVSKLNIEVGKQIPIEATALDKNRHTTSIVNGVVVWHSDNEPCVSVVNISDWKKVHLLGNTPGVANITATWHHDGEVEPVFSIEVTVHDKGSL